MGNKPSQAAKDAAEGTKEELDQMFKVLENPLALMDLAIKGTRGSSSEKDETEITGGRTVMRMSEIRVATSTGVDDQILAGINDFFSAAQSSAEGDGTAAKKICHPWCEKGPHCWNQCHLWC